MTDSPNKPLSSRQDVLSFLDDLDSFSASGPNPGAPAASPSDTTGGSQNSVSQPEDAQSVLDFLDEITQRSSTPTASIQTKKPPPSGARSAAATIAAQSLSGRTLSRQSSNASLGAPRISVTEPAAAGRKSTESTRSIRSTREAAASPVEPVAEPAQDSTAQGGGWGWGSVFKQATTVLQQAKTVAEQARTKAEGIDLVKNLNQGIQQQISGQGENAKKWSEGVMNYVKTSGIDQIGKDLQATGLRSINDIINAVAPPIAEHEIIEVQLSYDMIGYDGIETLVYRSLSKIMEQVEGGDLVLNKGSEEKPKEQAPGDPERDLQAVEGYTEAYKLAHANLDQLIKRHPKADAASPKSEATPAGQEQLPITRCPVFVRIQPLLAPLPTFSASASTPAAVSTITTAAPGVPLEEEKHLFFLLLLRDPTNELSHATVSQSMPGSWLDIPFEENEWVEDIMVEVIRKGTEVIGQQYVNGRLTGRSIKNASNARASMDSNRGSSKDADGTPTSAPVTSS